MLGLLLMKCINTLTEICNTYGTKKLFFIWGKVQFFELWLMCKIIKPKKDKKKNDSQK